MLILPKFFTKFTCSNNKWLFKNFTFFSMPQISPSSWKLFGLSFGVIVVHLGQSRVGLTSKIIQTDASWNKNTKLSRLLGLWRDTLTTEYVVALHMDLQFDLIFIQKSKPCIKLWYGLHNNKFKVVPSILIALIYFCASGWSKVFGLYVLDHIPHYFAFKRV